MIASTFGTKVLLSSDNNADTLAQVTCYRFRLRTGVVLQRLQGNQYLAKKEKPNDAFPKAYGFYRFHVPDPIYFFHDIRVTIQVMGGPAYQNMLDALKENPGLRFMKAGEPNCYYTIKELEAEPQRAEVMERTDDYCATAYWYMDSRENYLGTIVGFAERVRTICRKDTFYMALENIQSGIYSMVPPKNMCNHHRPHSSLHYMTPAAYPALCRASAPARQ